MTDALVQFLRARLDDDEQAARRVESSWRQIGETGVIVASDGARAEECANGNWTGVAEHIVRHDPARVLAGIDGRRRIVDDYAYYTSIGGHTDAERGRTEGLTYAVQCLALPYAGHLDFRDEWRP
jgi:hypothetical protein